MKRMCEQDKKNIDVERGMLQRILAKVLYEKSIEKAKLSNAKKEECSRALNNIDAIVSSLNESAKVYEEAAELARTAYNSWTSFRPYDDRGASVLGKARKNYQEAAKKVKEEAAKWPEIVLAQKTALKEQLTTLTKDSKLFEEGGLIRGSYDLQKQAISILETLIENGSDEEKKTFQEELTKSSNKRVFSG